MPFRVFWRYYGELQAAHARERLDMAMAISYVLSVKEGNALPEPVQLDRELAYQAPRRPSLGRS